MSVKSQQSVTVEFTTAHPTTGAPTSGDTTPTGTLFVDGVVNAAAVTVTNITTGVYRAAVTLPTLTAGQIVGIRIMAVVATVSGTSVVWQDTADTALVSDVPALDAAAVWGAGTKALTDKAGFSLAAAYDHAKDDVLTPLAAVSGKTTNLPADPASESEVEAAIAAATPVVDFTDVLEAIAALPTDTDIGSVLAAVAAVQSELGAVSVTIQSPVAAAGAVTVYQGDDYDATHGREMSFAVADSGHALGLDDVASVVAFKCKQAVWTATAVTSTTTGYAVTFEPTAAETGALTTQVQDYELEATLADKDVVTLTRGTLYVVRDVMTS